MRSFRKLVAVVLLLAATVAFAVSLLSDHGRGLELERRKWMTATHTHTPACKDVGCWADHVCLPLCKANGCLADRMRRDRSAAAAGSTRPALAEGHSMAEGR